MARRNVTDRSSLVDTAAALVAAHGVDGARLVDVAAAAGVSVGTVYNHFPSKDHLLDEVAHRLEVELVTAMAATAPDEVPLREALPDLVRAVLAVAARSPTLRVLSERAGARRDPGGEAPLLRGWIAQRVARAQRAGEVGTVDPVLVADLGFTLLRAAMSRRPAHDDPGHDDPAHDDPAHDDPAHDDPDGRSGVVDTSGPTQALLVRALLGLLPPADR